MRSTRRILSAAATGILAVGMMTIASPMGAAHAAASDCTNGKNGFVDIPYNKTGTVINSITLDGSRKVELHAGTINGAQHGWAIIRGATKKGDRVWMDWTQNSGTSWIQCGPFTVQSDGSPNTSAAKKTSTASGYRFRACGDTPTKSAVCGPWW
ncbi:hypothetical protein [Streptosporangium sp. NPDC087985]|uniref:hypothetical protein n=1 Tax=Streptosporangium sp. NPDC087985 TaxID=3366196 RepID=UPI003815CD12